MGICWGWSDWFCVRLRSGFFGVSNDRKDKGGGEGGAVLTEMVEMSYKYTVNIVVKPKNSKSSKA